MTSPNTPHRRHGRIRRRGDTVNRVADILIVILSIVAVLVLLGTIPAVADHAELDRSEAVLRTSEAVRGTYQYLLPEQ